MPKLYNALLFPLLVLLTLACAEAGTLQLAVSEEPPPADLPQAIRDALQPQKHTVSKDGNTAVEFWFPGEVEASGAGGMALGVNFNQFQTGAFLGIVRLVSTWHDYKNKPIEPGLYTLRYGQQPADGNHTGITLYRDYVILLPAELDEEPETRFGQPDLNQLSRLATGTPHPGIMALFPIWDEVEGAQIVPNEIDQPTLVHHWGGLQIGFVLEGHGELEGY